MHYHAECRIVSYYAECHHAECHYAECCGASWTSKKFTSRPGRPHGKQEMDQREGVRNIKLFFFTTDAAAM